MSETFDLNFRIIAHNLASGPLKAFAGEAHAVADGVRKAFIGIGAGATLAIGESLRLASGFDEQMRKSFAIAGLSREEFDSMKQSVLELSTVVPKSAEDLAQGLYLVESAGFKGKTAMQILEESAKAATSGLTDTRIVADAVTSALNAYRLTGKDAGDVTGKLTAAVTAGKTEYGALAGSIGRVLPMASQLGVGFDQVLANMSTLTNVGLSADEAATSLNGLFTNMVKGSPGAEKALKSVGLSMAGVRDELKSKGLLATLQELMDKTGGNVTVLAKIFPNIRALRDVLGTTGSQAEAYAGNLQKIAAAGKEANDAAFGKTMEGDAAQMALLKNQLSAVAIELGDKLLPHLIEFARWAREAVKGIEAWVKQNPELAKFAAIALGVAAGLSAISVVVGPLVAVVGGLLAVFGGPLLLAIAAVIAIGVLLVTHWTEISESARLIWAIVSALFQKGVAAVGALFSALGSKVREVLDAIGSTVGGFFDHVGTTIHDFFGFWGNIWATFSEKPFYWIAYFVTTAVRNFLEFTSKVLQTLGDFFTALPGNVGTWLGHVFEAIGTFVHNALEAFGRWTTDTGTTTANFFTELPGRLVAWLGEAFNAIGTFAHDAWNAFVEWRDNVKTTIWNFFLALPGQMVKFGKALVQGLIDGIGSMFSALGSTISNIVGQITGGIKSAIGGVPSSVAAAVPAISAFPPPAPGGGSYYGPGVPHFATGGFMQHQGLAYLHAGEQVLTPEQQRGRGERQVIHTHVYLKGKEIAQAVSEEWVIGARLAGGSLG